MTENRVYPLQKRAGWCKATGNGEQGTGTEFSISDDMENNILS